MNAPMPRRIRALPRELGTDRWGSVMRFEDAAADGRNA